MDILEMNDVSFYYGGKKTRNSILEGINYSFESGKMYAILGKSGAGKSTTLALLGALESPREGRILFKGEDIRKMGYNVYRNRYISIIFQNYNLLTYLTGFQNVKTATKITKNKTDDSDEHITQLLEQVGISPKTASQQANRLSGGEQQRIAIARAVVTDSEIILADEPTGNLDDETAADIIDLLYNLAHESGKCVIVVTHTKELAERADYILRLENKNLEVKKGE